VFRSQIIPICKLLQPAIYSPKGFQSIHGSGSWLVFCIRYVAQQEQQLAKELAEKRDLVREMDGKLHKACRALDKKNRD